MTQPVTKHDRRRRVRSPVLAATKQLPSSVMVLGTKYRVVMDARRLAKADEYGETDLILRLITVDEGQDYRRRVSTLVHEWVHACLHVSGLSQIMSEVEGLEEGTVVMLENALEQLLVEHGQQLVDAYSEDRSL